MHRIFRKEIYIKGRKVTMKFQSRSEQEITEMNLIQPGIYAFEVIDAVDAMSHSGNEMIKLELKVWDDKGRERKVYDYLLEALAFKLRHFAVNCGLIEKYEKGELSAQDCKYKSGKLELIVQKGKENKIEGGMYPDRNSVKDYVGDEVPLSAVTSKQDSKVDPDEDVPF